MCEEAMMFGMNYQDIVTSRDKDILVGYLWPGILSGSLPTAEACKLSSSAVT